MQEMQIAELWNRDRQGGMPGRDASGEGRSVVQPASGEPGGPPLSVRPPGPTRPHNSAISLYFLRSTSIRITSTSRLPATMATMRIGRPPPSSTSGIGSPPTGSAGALGVAPGGVSPTGKLA